MSEASDSVAGIPQQRARVDAAPKTVQVAELTTRGMALIDQLQAGGADVRQIIWTANRRTMISRSSRDRATLRIHRYFARAPGRVVDAIAAWLRDPRSEAGLAALGEIRSFLQHLPLAPAARRLRRHEPMDQAHLARLRAEFDRVNRDFFQGELPAVPIAISGRMRTRNGHFSARPVEIVISRTLCADAAPGEAEHTLRHEMIHLWQHHTQGRLGHGADFRRWARLLDVHPRARRPVIWKGETAAAKLRGTARRRS